MNNCILTVTVSLFIQQMCMSVYHVPEVSAICSSLLPPGGLLMLENCTWELDIGPKRASLDEIVQFLFKAI